MVYPQAEAVILIRIVKIILDEGTIQIHTRAIAPVPQTQFSCHRRVIPLRFSMDVYLHDRKYTKEANIIDAHWLCIEVNDI